MLMAQLLIILFYLHLAFMIRAFLILYPIIPDTAETVAPTAFFHIRKMQLKLCEAKKKLHTVTEKISDLTKKRDSLRQQVGQSK
jgi:predicted transglutaminase-like cysteine proteinase